MNQRIRSQARVRGLRWRRSRTDLSLPPRLEELETRTLLAAALGPLLPAAGEASLWNNATGTSAASTLVLKLVAGQESALARLAPAVSAEGSTLAPTGAPDTYAVHGNRDALTRLDGLFAADPAVRSVAPEQIVRMARTPDDPKYLDNTLYGLNGSNGINAPSAWDATTGSTFVTVADLDSGIDYNHPDLYENVWLNQAEIPASRRANLIDIDGDGLITFYDLNDARNQGPGKITDVSGDGRIDAADVLAAMQKSNGVDNGLGGWADGVSEDGDTAHVDDLVGWNFVANNNNPFDDNGHGTHTAGTIGAMGNNNTGVAGVDWKALLMPVKFLGSDGNGSDTNAELALHYAADHGARISNNSYALPGTSAAILDGLNYASSKGQIVVAAAGNNGSNNDTTFFAPASYHLANMIVVAATDSSAALASTSNYGHTTVDVGAPGVGIYSTLPGNSYGSSSGTSMAAAYVAGTAALVLGQHPTWTYSQVIQKITSTTTPDSALNGVTVTGGIVNAGAAVDHNIWNGYAQGPQHTDVSTVASQPLQSIHWQTPVDLSPQYSGNDLLIHYGSPLVTQANTVVVPVKTGATGGFEVEGLNGTNGAVLWVQSTDYVLPPHNWVPSFSPTLLPSGKLVYAGKAGGIYIINSPDSPGASATGPIYFYGQGLYNSSPAAFDAHLFISTPITSDAQGTIYFGYLVTSGGGINVESGIARVTPAGVGTWTPARVAANDNSIVQVVMNCAPALSNDGSKLYIAVSAGNFNGGYLVELNSTTLASVARVRLKDVKVPGNDALLPDDGSASPTVGPDGDVYFGVLENDGQYASKGWMLHFSGDLSQTKTAGAFGWDDTASIVDRSLVPSYTGSSPYLLMTKYNNYADFGLDGVNKIAILDPNATQVDSRTGATVMKEVLTIAGVTPDQGFRDQGFPNAVREWCINAAAIDPFTKSVLANSEDGKLYRWDLTTNTFTQVITLTAGVGEAYTPTVIGRDGTVYAINNATLFAIGLSHAYYSMPTNLAGNQGTVVSVPVSINHLVDADGDQGLTSAEVVLMYDPNVFTVSNGDVSPGALLTSSPPNGTWNFQPDTAKPGEVDISVTSPNAAHDVTSQTGGILANINFHIKGAAPTGNSTIHVVVPQEPSPNGLNGVALPASGPHSASGGGDFAGYTLSQADQVDGVVNIQNFTPITTLSIPTNLSGRQGTSITVPVNVSNPDPNGSAGMISADADILFDPSIFTVAATGAVTAGSIVPSTGWTVSYAVDTSGNNTVDATKAALVLHLSNTNNTPLMTSAAGSLWLVTFSINTSATPGTTALNLVPSAKVGASTTPTNATGANKVYQLSPAPTNATNDAVDGSVTVQAAATHFVVSAPSTATAGSAFNFTVTALTAGNATDPGYTGTVHFTSTDGQAVLPGNSTLTNGVGTFSATLKTAGNQTITATDTVSSITGTSGTITVSPAATTHLGVSAPSSATAGSAFSVTVTALDAFGNAVPGYRGTVHFTRSDSGSGSSVPADYTFVSGDNGTHTFTNGVTLVTAGNQTITATDTSTSSITGTSNSIAVSAAAATHFAVSAPSSATAGSAFSVTVTALDQFNNTATGYSGKAHFTKSDSGSGSSVPADYTFTTGTGNDNGSHTFTNGVTFVTAGTQTITATDTSSSSITGTSNSVAVSPAAANHFVVSAPSSTTAGVALNFTVTAFDPFNNTATGYTGTVHFTSSDSAAVLPANSTLTNGVGTFSATLKTAGSRTITATDTTTSSITGTSNTITVSPATATHLSVSAPSSPTAGVAFSITVTAQDLYNNTATSYTGTIHFTRSDAGSGSAVPANYTFVSGDNGSHTFTNGVTLVTAGAQTVTATDTITSSITGSASVTVSPAAATHFVVSAPSSTTAGSAFIVTVTALDAFNNTASGYTGTVHFTSTDGSASLPADSALTNGSGNFIATLKTAGSRTITATDTSTSSITGTSGAVSVSPAAATHFSVSAPSTATAGAAFSITVTAQDPFNNTATGYSGKAHFTRTDSGSGSSVPADYTFVSGDNGSHTFTNGVTLVSAGSQTITATDTATSSITGTSNTISVSPAAATHFAVTAPSAATAGSAFSITVTALDAFNNTATGYTGKAHFTKSDGGSGSAVPADYTFTTGTGGDSGTHTFTNGVTFVTAGSQTVTATDAATSSITGTSNSISVAAAAATHFAVSAPGTATAGSAFSITVTALDAFNNTATGYAGTVHFTSSDGQAALPADGALSSGAGTFSATLKTAGNRTITATDTANGSITGTSGSIAVSAAALSKFVVAAPAGATTGSAFSFNVSATDAFGNVISSYAGTVHFTSSDGAASLPANSTLTSGSGTFSATLNTSGSQSITATDTTTSSITGTSNAIAVRGLIVTAFTPTPTGFTASFSKAFVNSSTNPLNLYDAASANYGAPDVVLSGPGGTVRGSLIVGPSNTGFTFVKTGGPVAGGTTGLLAAGTYTVTFVSGATAFKDASGAALDGNSDGINGDNYTTSFTVSAPAGVVVTVPDFARGPDATDAINVPNNGSNGLPIALSNGSGVTDGTFVLSYNANLLNITGGTVNPALSGATFTVSTSGSGASAQATITFHSNTALAAGAVRLGGLVAKVPADAAYKSKELLHFVSTSLNGGAIASVPDDGVHVVAFLGDTSGDGTYTSADSVLLLRVASASDTGLAAFPLADPVIIGDITGDGRITSADATGLNLYLAGTAVAQVPPYPGPPSNNPARPDPTLSIPTDLRVAPGGVVSVPVNLDDPHPVGSRGMTQAVLGITYDPRAFSVSAQDVRLGSIPLSGTGWSLQSVIDAATGQIGIILFSPTPIASAQAGSLVTIDFHARPGAPLGASAINLAASVSPNGKVIQTAVDDDQGPFTLGLAPTNAPGDDGDGRVLITAQARLTSDSAAQTGALRPLADALPIVPVTDVRADVAPEDDLTLADSSPAVPVAVASMLFHPAAPPLGAVPLPTPFSASSTQQRLADQVFLNLSPTAVDPGEPLAWPGEEKQTGPNLSALDDCFAQAGAGVELTDGK